MFQVVKRDGELDEFKMGKITAAIDKAFDAKGKNYSPDMIDLLGLRVTADFQNKIENNRISVEDIQDSVENVLIQAGYSDVAKAYILYRKQREKIRNMKSTILDYKELVNKYVKNTDWRVKENSTVTFSVGGLILHNSGAITANYWLSEIYDDEIAQAHNNADLHIHDLIRVKSQLVQKVLGVYDHIRQLYTRFNRCLLRYAIIRSSSFKRVSAAYPAKSPHHPQVISQRSVTRWSTSSVLCRTSGRERRRSPLSIPILRPL